MVFTQMTDEQVSILTHVEALVAPLADSVAALVEQGKADRIVRAQEVAEARVQMAQLSERIGKVESRLDVNTATENTRKATLKLTAAIVTGTIVTIAALGGFVLAILQVVLK